MNGDLALVVGILLLALGAAGTLVSILFLGVFFGQWAMAVSVLFVVVGVVGALLIGSNS
ncbi:hypothetical protein [Rhodococcus sp. SGAir0479]|uniref:hypothetical protein n=1 Tax=Rhodococcus sp. SGAir0479 TaxID=2567884 RepID=UPI0015866BBD|nr:hypothetical protein [Rhodococcus sp. SGAir0479]